MTILFTRHVSNRNIAIFALMPAVGQWIWVTAEFIHLRQMLAASKLVIVDWDPSFLMMHIRIGIALAIAASSLFSTRVIGLLVAAIASVWVFAEYFSWYVWSSRIRGNLEHAEFSSMTPHALNLYGARWWNIAILILVITLLLWEIKLWIEVSRRKDFNSQGHQSKQAQ